MVIEQILSDLFNGSRQALIRRSSGSVDPTSLMFGDLSLELLKREVQCAGKRIELQPREFAFSFFPSAITSLQILMCLIILSKIV